MKLLLLAVIVLLVGCDTPTYLYRLDLTPTNGESLWENGNQKTSVSSDGWQAAVAYKGMSGPYLEFDITIKNTGIDTILVDPNKIQYALEFLTNDSGKTTYVSLGNRLDPELTITETEFNRKRVEGEKNPYDETGLELGLSIASGVLEIATLFKKDTRSQEQKDKDAELERNRRHEAEVRENNRIQYELNRTIEIHKLQERVNFFRTHALRKTTLLPTQSVTGLFYCSYYAKAKSVNLTFNLNDISRSVQYKQDAFYRQ